MRKLILSCVSCFSLIACIASPISADTASFLFGAGSNGFTGLTSVVLNKGSFDLNITAGPTDGLLNELDLLGMGVSTGALPNVDDGDSRKFNVLGGASPLSGQGEQVEFFFDQPGVITDLFFDGVKDESFEFFRLETPSGQLITYFDSQIGLRIQDLGLITEPNVTLLEEDVPNGIDDDIFNLSIPFGAGEVFTMIYGEFLPDPEDLTEGSEIVAGNGARWQGITVASVPEPASLVVLFAGLLGSLFLPRRR